MSQDLPGDTFVGPRFGMWRPTQCVRHGQADEGRRSHHAGHRQVPRGEPCDVVPLPDRGRRCLIGRNVEVGRRSRMSPTSSLVYDDVPSVIFWAGVIPTQVGGAGSLSAHCGPSVAQRQTHRRAPQTRAGQDSRHHPPVRTRASSAATWTAKPIQRRFTTSSLRKETEPATLQGADERIEEVRARGAAA